MKTEKANNKNLRLVNRRLVLEHIYFQGPLSRSEISDECDLSVATVTNLVTEFLAEGSVIEIGSEESQGGRPRTILQVNPTHGYFIGVDVNETVPRLELFDLTLKRLQCISFPLEPDEDRPYKAVRYIINGIYELLHKENLQPEAIIGVGVSIPGIVDLKGMVSAPAWGWQPIPILELLAQKLPMPIFVDNGAKAMAQAERWFGAGVGTDNLAVVLVGTGVGAGLITEGHLYRGTSNSAGEWGHNKIAVDGLPCRCGGLGCLEAYVGAPGIINRLRELAPDHPTLQNLSQETIIQALIKTSSEGDLITRKVLSETATYLGVGLANLVNLLNPQRVVIGGWLGIELGECIFTELKAVFERNTLPQALKASQLKLSQLGLTAASLGASTLALEAFLTATARKNLSNSTYGHLKATI